MSLLRNNLIAPGSVSVGIRKPKSLFLQDQDFGPGYYLNIPGRKSGACFKRIVMTLFNGNPVDKIAFAAGLQACLENDRTGEKPANPYPEKSDQWHSWNKGWNSYDPETETVTVDIPASDFIGTIRAASPEELAKAEPENPVIVDLFDIMNAPVLSDNTQVIGMIYKKPMQL